MNGFRKLLPAAVLICAWHGMVQAETGAGLSNVFSLDTKINETPALRDSLLIRIFPFQFAVFHNQPDDAANATSIRVYLPAKDRVNITVYAFSGKAVRILQDQVLPAGLHECLWDGKDDRGTMLPPGVYRCVIRYRHNHVTRALQLLQ